ncbi:hypothetical protein [Amycolatopsis sp. NPDC059657]|uniref:hypothetical protein n=1 Tax=Amycolatopsis sp. NPDC059657 TaxID=3346899 RepID=UPI0036705B76
MTEVVLIATAAAPRQLLEAPLVAGLLRELAGQDSGFEHVRASSGARRVELVFFSVAADAEAAAESATRLCARLTETAPQLRGWLPAPFE